MVQTTDLDRLYQDYRRAEEHARSNMHDSKHQEVYQQATIAYQRALSRFQAEQQ